MAATAAAAAAADADATEPAGPDANGERKHWTTGVREFFVPTGVVRPRGGDARSPSAAAFSVQCGSAGGGWTGRRADGGGWCSCPCPGCADGDRRAEFQRHGRAAVFFDDEHAAPAATHAGESEGGSWHMTLKMPFSAH